MLHKEGLMALQAASAHHAVLDAIATTPSAVPARIRAAQSLPTHPVKHLLRPSVALLLSASSVRWQRRRLKKSPGVHACKDAATMERPLFDRLVVSGVKALEAAELSRVKAASEVPSESNGGWSGEPREWAEAGPVAKAKQFIADTLAGSYDRDAIGALIDNKIVSSKIMMFSFSTCPFCLKAKRILQDDYGESVEIYECDLEPDGYAVRAELGKRTGRTSMPSTWLGPDLLLGGCNDGGLGGVATLDREGKLSSLLAERNNAMGGNFSPFDWLASFGRPDPKEMIRLKRAVCTACADAPKNGVEASEEVKQKVESAAASLTSLCPANPARMPLTGVWDLLYCTAPGGSSGKLGPFVGDVTQTFVDEVRFVNAVELGPLRIALEAERAVIDDYKIQVTFKEMAICFVGSELFRMPAKGQGVWQQRYVDDNLRVMNTPSLFVLRKRRI
eukprot:TRINITY_DN15895_c0_g1_i2.p1 TRINITY_DN15895_c0_g1~~TRINITY_DN15895_c0_g1_i2.p1  ORF type:complete len:447 (-),score=72.42 TRINITY_DN15895_c0_g1_i2:120-1460(-)